MILVCFGTRPEFIKINPLIKKFKEHNVDHKLCFTGQHETLLQEVEVDQRITIKDSDKNRLDDIISSVMNGIDFTGVDYVLVQGDTATAYGIALSAFHHQVKIVHLEAGMRTHDITSPYPEEFYRQCISKIADVNLVPSRVEQHHLITEGARNIFIVGNTINDNLINVETEYGNKVLVTLHRRENHDKIRDFFVEINDLAKLHPELEFVLPIHPNPNVICHKDILTHVNVTDPLPYDELLNLLASCRMCITDSGGIQEEASFLGKRLIVCRDKTERVSLIDNFKLCPKPNDLKEMFESMINNYEVDRNFAYGRGNACEKIVRILK
jgi:UDP-N-acetylglucosamine 2-epimerase (non-hydrolysing)